jgi:hypothetical protein
MARTMLSLFVMKYHLFNRSDAMATTEPSENWIIQPQQETPDFHLMTIEEWRVAVERWCRQFEDQPQKTPLSPQEVAMVKVVMQQAAESHSRRLAGGA